MVGAHGQRLTDNQRAIDDVLIRITYADERPSLIEYATRERANYLLARYSRSRWINGPRYALVEKVSTA